MDEILFAFSLQFGKSGLLIGFVLVGNEVYGVGGYAFDFVEGVALVV